MSLLLVAHGTRKPEGVAKIGELADRVSELLEQRVHVAFVDVLGPTPREVLRPSTIVVPAFLARGYHVNTDIPAHVAASGHTDALITQPLGPSPQIVRVLADRLVASGWRQGDSVILAAAGTSDPAARRDLHTTAAWLSGTIGARVELAFVATGGPRVAEAVAALRNRGAARVVVASYLLSEGLFHDRLRKSGADIVTEPLGTHFGTVQLVANRFRRARIALAHSAVTA